MLDSAFVGTLRNFIAEGSYEMRERTEGTPILYSFAKPQNDSPNSPAPSFQPP